MIANSQNYDICFSESIHDRFNALPCQHKILKNSVVHTR